FGAHFPANDAGVGGEIAASVVAAGAPVVRPARILAQVRIVHLGPIERAVAARRNDRLLPAEIAPLAGLRAGAEALLQRRDVIRHAATVPGIVLPYDRLPGSPGSRPVDRHLAIHGYVGDIGDIGDIHDGDVAAVPVAGA